MRLAHERKVAIKSELLKAAKEGTFSTHLKNHHKVYIEYFSFLVLPILREVIGRGVSSRDSPPTQENELASQASIKCLSSWIQHGVGVGLEESLHLVEPLLSVALNPDLSETALDALTHLVNHPEAHRLSLIHI